LKSRTVHLNSPSTLSRAVRAKYSAYGMVALPAARLSCITPSLPSLPSPAIHGRSFVRFELTSVASQMRPALPNLRCLPYR
jgi:hypothetical protein